MGSWNRFGGSASKVDVEVDDLKGLDGKLEFLGNLGWGG